MKKIIALALCLIAVAACFTGCSTLKKGDKGMEITVYLGDEIVDFDPTISYTDSSMVKILSLVYEGLTKLDSKGKWQKALMKDYKVTNSNGTYKLSITIIKTMWSDGRLVQADDFVTAWRRVLDPEYKCEAATLLYDIKNAYEAKLGDCSIYDIGIKSINSDTFEIEFNHEIDVNEFFTKVSSVALVPLREDVWSKDADWGKKLSSIVTNGPFAVKVFNVNETLRLERSIYYKLEDGANSASKEALDKYVIPYRLIVDYSKANLNAQYDAFKSDDVLYLGEIPLDARKDNKKNAVVTDELNTYSFVFNMENDLFSKKEVRQALSLVLDRDYIANEILVFADPATGYVPNKVNGSTSKKTFRDEAGSLVVASADLKAAKDLLAKAGVKKGTFTLTIRDNEEDVAIANYVKEAWEQLGFTVKIKPLAVSATLTGTGKDRFEEAYNDGNFDVIAIDSQLTAPDAFSALAKFAKTFSGNGTDLSDVTYPVYGHISGYNSEEYNALIMKAYNATSTSEKYEALREAEKLLIEDMPIIPVVFTKDAYLASKQLSNIKTTYVGARDLSGMKQKNYYEYKMAHTVVEEAK